MQKTTKNRQNSQIRIFAEDSIDIVDNFFTDIMILVLHFCYRLVENLVSGSGVNNNLK